MDENTTEKANGENTGEPTLDVLKIQAEMKEIREAFEESPYFFDEILDVYFEPHPKGDRYYVKAKNGPAIQKWVATRGVTGEWGFFEDGEEQRRFLREQMERDGISFADDEPQPFGGLLPAAPPPLAKQMGDVIHRALGESPTPESCEKAIKLATAAQAFLSEMRMPYFSEYQHQRDNLQRLAETIGVVRDDADDTP